MKRLIILWVLLFVMGSTMTPPSAEAVTTPPYEVSAPSGTTLYQFVGKTLKPKGNWYIPSPPYQLRVPNIDTYCFDVSVPEVDSKSFKFQIHYFTTLNQLTQAYAVTGNNEYLRYGKRIVTSWTKQYPAANYKRYP
ncbi:hypothetical protein [Exiguobacterium aurantiacum]|uniref:Uncharacterized protein n=1 Tax=Exiguobacterium aurantiacum TaxID=33987 RepID=A0ABY5FN29_9BACL|nr:hypothetical protein [Exiguobacterium aurantiacum]UTT42863.1 hypothetical protein NMQ00_15320 [Exiguobacterium aurantiacum]